MSGVAMGWLELWTFCIFSLMSWLRWWTLEQQNCQRGGRCPLWVLLNNQPFLQNDVCVVVYSIMFLSYVIIHPDDVHIFLNLCRVLQSLLLPQLNLTAMKHWYRTSPDFSMSWALTLTPLILIAQQTPMIVIPGNSRPLNVTITWRKIVVNI